MRYMVDKGLSSGETTHMLMRNLIREEKLDMEKINSQVQFLTVNEKFSFDEMQVESLKSHIQEVLKPFGKLVKDCKIRITKTKIANSDEYEIDKSVLIFETVYFCFVIMN